MSTSPRAALALLASLAAVLIVAAGCQKNGSSSQSPKPAPASSLGVRGGHTNAASKPYALTVQAPQPGAVGSALVATIKLVPRGGYKVNLEYPTKLVVRAAAATTPEQTLTARDAQISKERALFKPTVTLTKAGTYDVKAELKFSVCTQSLCELKRETLSWRAEAR